MLKNQLSDNIFDFVNLAMMICNINKIDYRIGYYKNIEVALLRLNSKIVLFKTKDPAKDNDIIFNYDTITSTNSSLRWDAIIKIR